MKKLLTGLALLLSFYCFGQSQSFTLSLPDPASQVYYVEMVCTGFKQNTLELKLPVWTPGYYQILNYAKYVSDFNATDDKGNALKWSKSADNAWTIEKGKDQIVKITYASKATIPFVANSLLDAEHGYVMPAGVFMHVRDYLKHPVTLTINNYPHWSTIATGLDPVPNKTNTYSAPDFDTFYDSPILLGNLEELPGFSVKNIPHRFIGYKLGEFDKKGFMEGVHKIVQHASDVIGDIPYKHYTFLAVGPVPGGIEHLNSTGFGFSGNGLDKRDGLLRMYTFLAHEYFHHYNAKRIRPIELGPFDYDHGSKTTMLWIAEGFTNYYDELIVKRAGLMTKDEYLASIRSRIQGFENKPGRLFQTAAEASYQTWSDGPFGRTGDDAYKTISVYEKGSILGLILDLTIRHQTQNKQSLDNVMRYVYQEYYQRQKRGFTEKEFQAAAEKTAGIPLPEFFEYVNTVKEIDYKKYFAYAGLEFTEKSVELPNPYLGIATRMKNDTLLVSRVEWQSPAWEAGIRTNDKILSVNDGAATRENLEKAIETASSVRLALVQKNKQNNLTLQSVKRIERQFTLQPVSEPSPLQTKILASWLNE